MGEALTATPAEWSRELSHSDEKRGHRFRWLFHRLLMTLFVVWGSVTLLFVIFFIVPGDRVDKIVGGDRVLDATTRAQVVDKYALDEPLIVQYTTYWGNVLTGDLGSSYVNDRSVSDILGDTTKSSLRLAFWAVAFEVVIGAGLGIVAALKRSRLIDFAGLTSTVLLLSVPVFVLGFVLQLLFGVLPFQNGWTLFKVQGIGPDSWFLGVIPTGEQWRYLVLPAVTLGAISGAVLYRLTRETVSGAMNSTYANAARARGVRERDVVVRHVLRNSVMPLLTFVAIDIATLFGAAVVTESVFNWPGVGSEMAKALARADAPVVLGLTLVLAIAYSLVNLIVDIVHAIVDPRVS